MKYGATELPAIVNDELDPHDSINYLGYHIMHLGDGKYQVQMDGYAGVVRTFTSDDFDTALELVDELNRIDTLREEHQHYGDDDALVEWAGKIMTSREELADDEPDKYIHIPDDAPTVEELEDPLDPDEAPDVDLDDLDGDGSPENPYTEDDVASVLDDEDAE